MNNTPGTDYPTGAGKPSPSVSKNPAVAMVLEIGFGLFGILGVGHLYLGQIVVGLIIMFAYWVLLALGGFMGVLSGGFGLCVGIPLAAIIIAGSAFHARNQARKLG